MICLLIGAVVLMPTGAARAQGGKTMNVHSFSMKTIDGDLKSLSDYKGKVLLIVNTASRCGFTPQYAPLEALYEKYRARGFEVLAFPANEFLGQEPGSDAEIKSFCSLKYKTTFPLYAKSVVKGKGISDLYRYLTEQSPFQGEIAWNFNKFLVNGNGDVVARFGSRVDPLANELVEALEAILPSGVTAP
ncbi:MAG: glutathione peroxidase [Candidatus Omnitrophota bacterium]